MSELTAPGAPDRDELPEVDPEDVPLDRGDDDRDPDEYRTEVFELMNPRSRAAIVDALLQAGPDKALTVSEMVERHSGVTTSSFNRQKDDLVDHFGIMIEAEKQGNAQTYRLNKNHPVVQLLGMINQIYNHGTTPESLDEKFLRDGL